ncbi:glutathione S-transferase, partial [Ramicandelaber brevisporus]
MSAAIGKLHGFPATFRGLKARVVAEYAGIPIDIIENYNFDDRQTLPTGKVPALEVYKTGEFISDSNAIAFYLASIAPAKLGLLGSTPEENAHILSLLFFANTELNTAWMPWRRIMLGWSPNDEQVIENAKSEIRRFFGVYEAKLAGGKKYLIGDRLTVADIVTYAELLTPFRNLLGPQWREEFPEVTRYFVELGKIE